MTGTNCATDRHRHWNQGVVRGVVQGKEKWQNSAEVKPITAWNSREGSAAASLLKFQFEAPTQSSNPKLQFYLGLCRPGRFVWRKGCANYQVA